MNKILNDVGLSTTTEMLLTMKNNILGLGSFRLLWSFALIIVLGGMMILIGGLVMYLVLLILTKFWAKTTSGGLMGEEVINSDEAARNFADRAMKEALEIFAEPSSNWQTMLSTTTVTTAVKKMTTSQNSTTTDSSSTTCPSTTATSISSSSSSRDDSDGSSSGRSSNVVVVDEKQDAFLTVQARRVTSGPFANSNVLMTRSEGRVVQGDADDIFRFLTSAEGFAVLDPASDPAEMNQYIQEIPNWRRNNNNNKKKKKLSTTTTKGESAESKSSGGGDNNVLKIAESYMRNVPPGYSERHHVVLNAYDYENRIFTCKSIVHHSRPGASKYFQGEFSSPSVADGDTTTTTTAQEQQKRGSKDDRTTNGKDDDRRVRAIATFVIQVIPEKSGGCIVKMINYTDMMMMRPVMNWVICKAFFPGVYERLNNLTEISTKKTN